MAAPDDVNLANLNGTFTMAKSISDDTDPVLALQGLGWLKRKAIGLATVTLTIKSYEKDGVSHVDIDSTATGGIKGTSEYRILDWQPRPHEDHIFGSLSTKNRWIKKDGPELAAHDDFLKEGWLDEKVGPNGEELIECYAINESGGWEGKQIWGFSLLDGKRWHTRRIVVSKGSEAVKVRIYYSYEGKTA